MDVTPEVSKQRRTVIGQVDYSLSFLKSLRGQLMDVSSPNINLNWAIGGFISILISALLHNIEETVLNKETNEFQTAEQNLLEIKKRFSDFIDLMLKEQANQQTSH